MPIKRADKTPMPVREAQMRARDFIEVNEGYTGRTRPSRRSAACAARPGADGCPVNVPIPDSSTPAMGDMAAPRDPALGQPPAGDLRARSARRSRNARPNAA
jgi:hypothetical protein